MMAADRDIVTREEVQAGMRLAVRICEDVVIGVLHSDGRWEAAVCIDGRGVARARSDRWGVEDGGIWL